MIDCYFADNFGATFFCRLREYHSLKTSGFGIRNKKIQYKPCKINLKIHEIDTTTPVVFGSQSTIIAEVLPMEVAYQSKFYFFLVLLKIKNCQIFKQNLMICSLLPLLPFEYPL